MNFTPTTLFGLLGLSLFVGLIAKALTSKETATDITALSNGWGNIEKAAIHG